MWEHENQLDGLKRALYRYAKERQGIQNQAKEMCPNCGAKKRKYDA
jgi:ribosome modulation factor